MSNRKFEGAMNADAAQRSAVNWNQVGSVVGGGLAGVGGALQGLGGGSTAMASPIPGVDPTLLLVGGVAVVGLVLYMVGKG